MRNIFKKILDISETEEVSPEEISREITDVSAFLLSKLYDEIDKIEITLRDGSTYTISEKKPALTPAGNNKKVKMPLITVFGSIELEGTEEQLNIFYAEKKERDDALYPRFLSDKDLISLAIGCGLSVKTLNTK